MKMKMFHLIITDDGFNDEFNNELNKLGLY